MTNRTKNLGATRSDQAAVPKTSNGIPGPHPKLTQRAHEELQLLQTRVQNLAVAEMLWEQLLSKDEKALFQNSLSIAWKKYESTLGIATHAWKCSAAQALLRIYRELGNPPASKLHWLERELGILGDFEKAPLPEERPNWKKDEGRLYWDNRAVRVVRSVLKATNIVRVLDAFQANKWCTRVENPLGQNDDHLLRRTVSSLNQGLTLIRFETAGLGVRWRVLEGGATRAPRG